MGKVVSGAAWEGPSGWGRWGGLSGTVSFPAMAPVDFPRATKPVWSSGATGQTCRGKVTLVVPGLPLGPPAAQPTPTPFHHLSSPGSLLVAGCPSRQDAGGGGRRQCWPFSCPVCLLLQRPLKREAL